MPNNTFREEEEKRFDEQFPYAWLQWSEDGTKKVDKMIGDSDIECTCREQEQRYKDEGYNLMRKFINQTLK